MLHEQGNQHSVVLAAVASGKIFEYSSGCRYENQRVKKILLDKCFYCEGYADRFSLTISDTIVASCSNHSYFHYDERSFREMEEKHNSVSPHKIQIRSVHSFVKPWELRRSRKMENVFRGFKGLFFSLGVVGAFTLPIVLAVIRPAFTR